MNPSKLVPATHSAPRGQRGTSAAAGGAQHGSGRALIGTCGRPVGVRGSGQKIGYAQSSWLHLINLMPRVAPSVNQRQDDPGLRPPGARVADDAASVCFELVSRAGRGTRRSRYIPHTTLEQTTRGVEADTVLLTRSVVVQVARKTGCSAGELASWGAAVPPTRGCEPSPNVGGDRFPDRR